MSLLLYWLIPLLIVIADQLLKRWAVAALTGIPSLDAIPGVFNFVLVYNDGAAFSILAGKQLFLILFTALALVLLVVYLLRQKTVNKLELVSLLMVLGGGIGNLIDRVLNGKVVDYIHLTFMEYPVFNFADICVCIGIFLFVAHSLFAELFVKKNG